MKVNVISNIQNGAGLEKDSRLIARLFSERGHQVYLHQFNALNLPPQADWNVFLETMVPQALHCASKNIYVPNPEWHNPANIGAIRHHVSEIWCKTLDCVRVFHRLGLQSICKYTAFESDDLHVPGTTKVRRFLHVAGKSTAKNTQAVVEAWRGVQHPLTVIAWDFYIREIVPRGVPITLLDRVDDNDFSQLINSHRFFLLPSMYEGFGHSLQEAMSCKATVITTDGPPMNETAGLDRRFFCPTWSKTPRFEVFWYNADPNGIRRACEKAMAMSDAELDEIGENARNGFLQTRDFFRKTIEEAIPRC